MLFKFSLMSIVVILPSVFAQGVPPDRNQTVPEKNCTEFITRECLNEGHLPNISLGLLCIRSTQKELIGQLQAVGGFNPQYVAMTFDDTQKFKDIRNNVAPPPNQKGRRQRRMSDVDDSSCWTRGQFVKDSRDRRAHLCGECHSVKFTGVNVVPRYINEAVCRHAIPEKAVDRSCVHSSGLCVQKFLTFPALIRDGFVKDAGLSNAHNQEIHVEKWVEFTQRIRSSCQCQIYSNILSILKIISGR